MVIKSSEYLVVKSSNNLLINLQKTFLMSYEDLKKTFYIRSPEGLKKNS